VTGLISLFDLLGVRNAASPGEAAAALWPIDVVQAGLGREIPPNLGELAVLMQELDASLEFHSIRSGADEGRVGLTAELHVGPPLPAHAIALARMPDVEFRLIQTGSAPPNVFVTKSDAGVAVVIDALPVEIRLPPRMLMPLEASPGAEIPLEDEQVTGFIAGQHDTLAITLRRDDVSSILVHVKVRYTEAREVVIEPAVPLSIGACRMFDLPVRGVHDLMLVPYPILAADPFGTEQPLEWTRHPLTQLVGDEPTGYVTMRTIDFDDRRSPFSKLIKAPNDFRAEGEKVEIVLEDLAVPMNSLLFPVPSHFTFGMRRKIGLLDDPGSAFDLSGLPVKIAIPNPADVIGGYMMVEQLLLRSVRFDDPNAADQQFLFAKLIITNDPTGKGQSATIDVTDEWTLELGWRNDPGIDLIKIFGLQIRLLGARVGLSFQRLTNHTQNYGVEDIVVAVADLELVQVEDAPQPPVALKPNLDKPKTIVIRDFGWRLGSFSIGKFWDPDGADLSAFDVIKLHLDEYGFVSDPNGGRYFAISATLPLGTEAVKPKPGTETPPDKDTYKNAGGGLTLHRLRTKIAGDDNAPQLLLDGITLGFREGPVQITGSGMIGDYEVDGVRYREFGIGAIVRIDRSSGADGSSGSAPSSSGAFTVGASFFYGHAQGTNVDFQYLLASAMVSPIPIGAVTLADVRALFAWHMTPTLGTPDDTPGSQQPMRLFEWYRANDAGLTLPPTRNMTTGGWTPLDDSIAIGVGAGVQVGGTKFVTIKLFAMYRRSPESKGFLAAVDLYPFKAKKPIAYGAFEIDDDRWSLLIGLSVGMENVTGKKIPLLTDAPFLTGTFYMTNKPGTLAIGHVDDPTSWLSLHVKGDVWLFKLELYAGICLELIDLPEGPRVLALRTNFSGGSRLFSIGGIDFYLTFEAIVGTWRNESNVSGFMVWFEGGITFDVFWVFDFGASAKVEWDWLGPDPAYRRLGCEVKIHTPWWMPDVTFDWNKTFDTPQLDKMSVASTPVVASSGRALAGTDAQSVAVSPIVGNTLDADATYSANDLAPVTGDWPAGALDDVTPIATDATVAVSFKATVDDRIAWGQNTPDGMGTQQSNDVSARYTLVEFGIRRKPSFGGGTWTNLLDPAASRIDPSLLDVPAAQLPARFASPVKLRWDADFQREQKLDSKQLLVNAPTPYQHILFDLVADENLIRTMPGWPCCGSQGKPVWHTLDFRGVPIGNRAPTVQTFTDSQSTLHWLGVRAPIVAGSTTSNPAIHVARMEPARRDAAPFARIHFDAPVLELNIGVTWKAMHVPRQLVVAPFNGLAALPAQTFLLSQNQVNGVVVVAPSSGMSHVVLRLTGEPIAQDGLGWLELTDMRYRAVDEVLSDLLGRARCGGQDAVNPGGAQFAWMANHDYEIRVVTRVTVKDERAGEITREVPQNVFFRTRGLPGLNAVDRIGEELDPYLESVYPAPGAPLYRSEAIRLAFNERFDMFQAIDRPPQPNDPPERQQKLDLVLCVERIGGRGELEQLSVPGPDWIVAHRGTVSPPPPPPYRPPRVIGADPAHPVLRQQQREAPSLDPQMIRFEGVLASPHGCDAGGQNDHRSRVLMHDPVDLDSPVDAQSWAALAHYRASLRLRASPFVRRLAFDAGDDTGFLWTGTGASSIVDAVLEIDAGTGATRYGSFGDLDWDHFTMRTQLRIDSGIAGFALGLQGAAASADACFVRIDSQALALHVVERVSGAEHSLLDRPLTATSDGVWNLQIDSYDDAWQVVIGSIDERVPKPNVRNGRVAVMATGTTHVQSLSVDGVDTFRFEFDASRWPDFEAHVASFEGRVNALPELAPATRTIADLVTAICTQPADADRFDTQRRFDDWIAALSIPLTVRVDHLEIGGRSTQQGVTLLMIESPEPFALGDDIQLTLTRHAAHVAILCPHVTMLDAAKCRALIVPVDSTGAAATLAAGNYRFAFELARSRYRTSGADADSMLTGSAVLETAL